jgi:hypothetical protein
MDSGQEHFTKENTAQYPGNACLNCVPEALRAGDMMVKDFIWTEERANVVREMWDDHSCSVIATRLGTSRNSVIGKARRMHLPKKKVGNVGKKVDDGRRFRPRRGPRPDVVKINRGPAPTLAPVVVTEEMPVPLNITLDDLRSHHCRWPTAEEAGIVTGYCGKKKTVVSYCLFHAKIAFKPPKARVRNDKQPWYRK